MVGVPGGPAEKLRGEAFQKTVCKCLLGAEVHVLGENGGLKARPECSLVEPSTDDLKRYLALIG